MEPNEEKLNEGMENLEEPAQDLLPDRDVLMMEKPMPDKSAARYTTADKKLLRNISLIVLFLIAVLIILMVIVRNSSQREKNVPPDATKEMEHSSP